MILRYLGRKFGVAPRTEPEQVRADLIEQETNDIFEALLSSVRDKTVFEAKRDALVKILPAKMAAFSKFLGERTHFAGNYVTYVDFLVYETLDVVRNYSAESFEGHANLAAFMQRIEANPNIAKLLEDASFHRNRFYAPFAAWGGGD